MDCLATRTAFNATEEYEDDSVKRNWVFGSCALTLVVAVTTIVIGVLTLLKILPPVAANYLLIGGASVSLLGALGAFYLHWRELERPKYERI